MTAERRTAPDEAVRRQAADWFARLRGPDAAAIRPQFEIWLNASPDHLPAWRHVEQLWDQSKFLQSSGTARSRDLASVAVWHRRPAARWGAAAMVVLALLVVGFAVPGFLRPNSATPMVAFSTRTGEVRTVSLADGSKVTLDASSSVQVAMSAATREVRMIDGTARFDVKPDPDRSFAVLTSRGGVLANGGLFDVTQSAGLVRVAALRGSVTFKSVPGPAKDQPAAFDVAPGQFVSVFGTAAPVLANAVPTPQRDWTEGMLSFDGERLSDAIAAFNRHNARKIVIADPAIAGLRITGAYHADDPMGFVTMAAELLGFEVRLGANGQIELRGRKKS